MATITDPSVLTNGLYLYFNVELQILGKIMGGIPKSDDVIEAWLMANLKDKSRVAELVDETKEAMKTGKEPTMADIDEMKKAVWTGFKSDKKGGLYIEGRQVAALLKEAANVLKNKWNLSAFKARVAERVFVREERIYMAKDKPDGSVTQPVFMIHATGPATALKKMDYVERPVLKFGLQVMAEPLITKGTVRFDGVGDAEKTPQKINIHAHAYIPALFEYGQNLGLGADRGQQHGRFQVIKCEPVEALF